MILGFKTGPKNWQEGQRAIEELGASMCEVWFDVTKADEYKEILAWLAKHDVSIGLHHWGIVDGKIKTNLATSDDYIRNETIEQIKKTIDIGATIGCAYVNAHPGAAEIETIDFTDWRQRVISGKGTSSEESKKFFLEAALSLTEYANKKDVLLTIESIPGREKTSHGDRLSIYNPGNIPLSALEEFAQNGGWFANDISHTGSRFLLSKETPEKAWVATLEFSRRMAPRTRLLHTNTITPPYNGTDSHDGITDGDFANETFPNKKGFTDFLGLFTDRDDVYAVNEPKEDLAGNFVALMAFAQAL